MKLNLKNFNKYSKFKSIIKNSHFKRNFSELFIKFKGKDISFSSDIYDKNTLDKAMKSRPMKEWLDNMEKQNNMFIKNINLQSIDLFGEKVGFVKIKVDAIDRDGDPLPGIIFMRGPSVSVFVILECNKKEYAVLVSQDSLTTTLSAFPQLPAGMLDDGNFSGAAARELKEETGIEIKEKDLVDLIQLSYKGKFKGMYPSLGACDEYVKLYLYKKTINEEEFNSINGRISGLKEENEKIKVSIVPLENACFESSDSKLLGSLCLYQNLKKNNILN